MNRRLTYLFVMLPVVMCLFQHDMLFGAAQSPRAGSSDQRINYSYDMLRGGFGPYNMDKSTSRILSLADASKELNKSIQEHEANLDALQKKKENLPKGTDMPKLDADIAFHVNLIKRLGDRRNRLFLSSPAGTLVARGFAGQHDWEQLDETTIGNVKDGLVQGLTLRASKAVGDVLGKRIEGSCEVVLGGAWDKMFGWLVDSWEAFCLLLFHEDKKPFQPEVLEGWLDFIESTLNDIERMVKDGLKDSLRGYDMTRRKFDLDATDDAENNAATQEVQENVWIELVFGYADQFERIAEEIVTRREFYEEDSLESFYATQIIKRLLDFKELLVTSKSLNDLDAQLHSNKAIIAATKTNLKNLFKRLVVKVTPRTYSLKTGKDSLSELSFNRNKEGEGGYRRGRSMDDDYPFGM
ncbi:hypothetical protein IPF37_06075 [bacterium]|nr:MAG: hypothetical protein IPF37_06075 [bacterium]